MTHINQRRDTSANWASTNPVLMLGEVGWETNTRKMKLGTGVAAWNDLPYANPGVVSSVNGEIGDVVLDKTDIGLPNVNNTSDLNKPVSTAQQNALNLKANLASPTFTGDPKAPTPATSDNDTSIATTAYVKAQLVSPTFTGDPKAPTPATSDNDTSIATTAFVKAVTGPLDTRIAAIEAGVWSTYTPVWTATTTNPVLNNGTALGRYRVDGKTCHYRFIITAGSTTTFGSGSYVISLPFASSAAAGLQFAVGEATIGGSAFRLYIRIAAGGSTALLYCDPTTAGAAVRAVSPTVPGTFANGHSITVEGFYELP